MKNIKPEFHLSKNMKKEYRAKLQDLVTKVSINPNERIKLDIRLLDELIFDYFKTTTGETIKIPVWTGDFLQYFDLSKLSFKNAFLDINCRPQDWNYPNLNRSLLEKECAELFTTGEEVPIVNFANCNLDSLDFRECYSKRIANCNFSNVNLEKASSNVLRVIRNCLFPNTQFKLRTNEDGVVEVEIYNVDFRDNDFHNYTVTSDYFPYYLDASYLVHNDTESDIKHLKSRIPYTKGKMFFNVNLSNTGLNIMIPKENALTKQLGLRQYYYSIDELQKKKMLTLVEFNRLFTAIDNDDFLNKDLKEALSRLMVGRLIRNGSLDGCYVNGILVAKIRLDEEKSTLQEDFQTYLTRLDWKIDESFAKVKRYKN